MKLWKRKRKTAKETPVEASMEHELNATQGWPLKERLLKHIEQDEGRLSVICSPLDEADTAVHARILSDLTLVAKEFHGICVGLSANQIGHPVKMFVVRHGEGFVPYINAKILAKGGGIKRHKESCLSRVGRPPVPVRRHKTIQIEYFSLALQTTVTEWILDRKTAHCIQHEIDHGNGVLI